MYIASHYIAIHIIMPLCNRTLHINVVDACILSPSSHHASYIPIRLLTHTHTQIPIKCLPRYAYPMHKDALAENNARE